MEGYKYGWYGKTRNKFISKIILIDILYLWNVTVMMLTLFWLTISEVITMTPYSATGDDKLHLYIYIYICVCVCMYVCVSVFIYIYIWHIEPYPTTDLQPPPFALALQLPLSSHLTRSVESHPRLHWTCTSVVPHLPNHWDRSSPR